MPQPNNDPFIKSKDFPYPIRKNANGGFDIILRPALTQGAITEAPAPVASDQLPPPMADEGGFVGNMPRPRPENGPPMPQAPAADAAAEGGGGVGDMMNDIFTGRGGELTTGTHDGMPPDMGGILPGGWKESLASMVGGMQNIDRNQSPLAALASGMGGAMTTRENRRKDKRAEMLSDEDRAIAAEERQYRHGRDTVEDQRNAYRDRLLGNADERAGEAHEQSQIEGGMKLTADQMALDKAQADLKADHYGMGAAEQAAADKNVADIMKTMGKSFALDPADTPEQMQEKTDKYLELQDKVREREYAKYAVDSSSHENPPGTAGSEVDASKPGVSEASAISWAPGQAPKSQGEMEAQLEAAVAANNGNPIYVRNPRTGTVGLYISKRAR